MDPRGLHADLLRKEYWEKVGVDAGEGGLGRERDRERERERVRVRERDGGDGGGAGGRRDRPRAHEMGPYAILSARRAGKARSGGEGGERGMAAGGGELDRDSAVAGSSKVRCFLSPLPFPPSILPSAAGWRVGSHTCSVSLTRSE